MSYIAKSIIYDILSSVIPILLTFTATSVLLIIPASIPTIYLITITGVVLLFFEMIASKHSVKSEHFADLFVAQLGCGKYLASTLMKMYGKELVDDTTIIYRIKKY